MFLPIFRLSQQKILSYFSMKWIEILLIHISILSVNNVELPNLIILLKPKIVIFVRDSDPVLHEKSANILNIGRFFRFIDLWI